MKPPFPAGALVTRLRLWLARLPASLRATILYAVGMGWSRGIGLMMVPVLTAHLAPEAFGRLELLSSAAEIGGLMVGAGLVETLFRFAAAPGEAGRRAAADVVGLTLALAAVCLVLVAMFGSRLAALMPLATSPVEIWLLGVLVVMDAVGGVTLGWLRMQGHAGAHALISGMRASVQAVLIALLLMAGLGVTGVLAGSAAAATLAAIWLVRGQARGTGITTHPGGWGRLLAYGAPLVGSGLAGFVLGSGDRWMLAGTVGAGDLGHYALAARFALIMAMLMQPFDLWWYSRRIAVLQLPDGPARTARVIRLGLSAIVVTGAATATAGPSLIALLAPASYAPAMAMVPWLVLCLCLQSLGFLVNIGCFVGRTTTLPLAINATAAATALGLYLLLIPSFGVPGAIAATVVAQSVRLVLGAVYSQRRVKIDLPYARAALLAVCATVTAAIPQLMAVSVTSIALSLLGMTVTAGLAGAAEWWFGPWSWGRQPLRPGPTPPADPDAGRG
jgi:O-antigen/teichoic acid export membrane protein